MLYSQRVVRRRNAIPLVILVPEKPFTITLYLKKKTVQIGDNDEDVRMITDHSR